MYDAVKTLHSYWAYLVLLIVIIAVVNAIAGMSSKRPFGHKDLRISLFGLIVTHIQLVIGLILYFVSPRFSLWSELGMGGVMKNAVARLYLVEHPFVNILAIVLITMGWSLHKKQPTDKKRFSRIAIMYGIGLVLLLSRIPWSEWI